MVPCKYSAGQSRSHGAVRELDWPSSKEGRSVQLGLRRQIFDRPNIRSASCIRCLYRNALAKSTISTTLHQCFQLFWWSGTPRVYYSGSRNLCSHIYTEQLNLTVDCSIFVALAESMGCAGGTPGLRWHNPRTVLAEP